MAGNDELKNMLMSFRMSELQALLGFAGRNKNGRKNDLQTRALDLLNLRSAPIQMKIRELHRNITQPSSGEGAGQKQYLSGSGFQQPQHNGKPPVYQGYFSGQTRAPALGTMPNNLPVLPDVKMKKLPFFDHVSELLKPSTLMPVGTCRIQEQSFVFHLTPTQANEIAFNRNIDQDNNEYVVQAQMRFCLLETSCEQEDCFPPGLIVQVNGKACPLPAPLPTTKQGVEPKRPPRPVDISPLVRISPTIANTVLVSWAAEFGRGYVISVNLVRRVRSAQLIRKLRTRGARPADYTTGLIKEKLRQDEDSEIATTSLRVSLLCPLGKMRMSLPCRPTTCSHLQCFDASLYLQMNERKPTWVCPVCNQPGVYDTLVIDGYFQEVLSSVRLPPDASEIELRHDGSWFVKQADRAEDSESLPLVKNRGGPPVVEANIEIVDDDVIPVAKLEAAPCQAPKAITTVDLTSDDDELDIITPPSAPATAAVGIVGRSRVVAVDSTPEIISLDTPSPPVTPEPPVLSPKSMSPQPVSSQSVSPQSVSPQRVLFGSSPPSSPGPPSLLNSVTNSTD